MEKRGDLVARLHLVRERGLLVAVVIERNRNVGSDGRNLQDEAVRNGSLEDPDGGELRRATHPCRADSSPRIAWLVGGGDALGDDRVGADDREDGDGRKLLDRLVGRGPAIGYAPRGVA